MNQVTHTQNGGFGLVRHGVGAKALFFLVGIFTEVCTTCFFQKEEMLESYESYEYLNLLLWWLEKMTNIYSYQMVVFHGGSLW